MKFRAIRALLLFTLTIVAIKAQPLPKFWWEKAKVNHNCVD